MSSDKILGIDLGTTNSAFAVMEGGDPEIIVNREGERTTPSVVGFPDGDDQNRLVGKPAKNQAVQNPEKTVESIKRHMGKEDYAVKINGTRYTPVEISAMILQKIKRDAEDYLGDEVERAVITVPAYFSDRQRQATKDAGEVAGFEVERIINEPTAASMAYGIDEDEDKTVLVYDLGGGTFDVSVLDIGDGVYKVAATDGDNELGGDDWDQAIMDWLIDNFQEEHGIDLTGDRQALQRLRDAAENAKIELSSRKETQIHLPFITAGDSGPLNIEETLSRAKFESLTEDLVERTVEPTQSALTEAGYETDEIDDVLLVGGSTRMPMVREKVEEIVGQDPRANVNPDEAVALGAAIQGGVLSGEVDDLVLLDVTPMSLGVEVKNGLFERLIDRNTTIPTEETKTFTTAEDGQTSVQISVYQGEREVAAENELLDKFHLTGIPPAPAGMPKIDVTFSIDENGIVEVTAEDKGSGLSEEITIEGGVGLSDEELENMQEEAQEYAEEDQRERERIEARNDAENALNSAKRVLEKNSDNIDSALWDEIERQMGEVEDLLAADSPNLDDIRYATEDLTELVHEAGQQNYQ